MESKDIKHNWDAIRTEMSKREIVPVKVTHMHLRTLERMYSPENKSDEKNPKAFQHVLNDYKNKSQEEKWAFCIEMLIAHQCYEHVLKQFEKKS